MIRKTVKQIVPANAIAIKPYTLIELARMYDVDRKTFRGWLKPFQKELGERRGRYYSIPQVKLIFQKLDTPSMLAA